MNNTYDSSLEARLRDIERKIDRLKDSLLPALVGSHSGHDIGAP
jgi:hypothetical protein